MIVAAFFVSVLGAWALSVTVDGVTYEEVRWGTATPIEVRLFHSGGVATVPLEKLPAEWQREFGYDPQKAAAHRAAEEERRRVGAAKAQAEQEERERHAAEFAAYRRDFRIKVLADGKLVSRAAVSSWPCFLVSVKQTYVEEGITKTGTLYEVVSQPDLSRLPPAMRKRPGLWQPTGSNLLHRVLYTGPTNSPVIEVNGVALGLVDGWPLVTPASDFTFAQWKALTGGLLATNAAPAPGNRAAD